MKLDNRGSSMVSVIVAFLILLMGIAMFTTSMYTATDLTQEAEDIRKRVDTATEKYYSQNETDVVTNKQTNGITLRQIEGAMGTNDSFKIDGEGYTWKSTSESYTMYYFKHNKGE